MSGGRRPYGYDIAADRDHLERNPVETPLVPVIHPTRQRPRRRACRIEQKLAETRSALDRYYRAFEAGTMPEDTCAPRIAALNEQPKHLRSGSVARRER